MPSTVRKLADALGVDPPVLMAESRIDQPTAAGEAQAWSKLPAKELDLQFRRERKEQERLEEARVKRQQARVKREQARKEWYEAGRWAERFVSGDMVRMSDSVPEEDRASLRSAAEGRGTAEPTYLYLA